MDEKYRLELNFMNDEGKSRKINIAKPVAGLTETEIEPVMVAITESNIFEDDGIDPYAQIKNARYVRTTVEEVFTS